jgi:hypothetical protein
MNKVNFASLLLKEKDGEIRRRILARPFVIEVKIKPCSQALEYIYELVEKEIANYPEKASQRYKMTKALIKKYTIHDFYFLGIKKINI